MDIDDILRDVDRGSDGDIFAAGLESAYGARDSPEADLQALTRAWVNERGSPEVLEWPPGNLIERVSARIKAQIEKVEEMTGDMDPKTNFGLIVVQTELERWKYLVRGYLRARIAKIDTHTLHYLSNPSFRARLSETEIAYATRHQSLLHTHYLSSFLSSFPVNLQNLNDTAGGISMIGGPDEEGGVFVRAIAEGVNVEGRGRDEDGNVEVRRGEVVVARWADVKELVEKGELELV